MLFKKGALTNINTRHYFRDNVFTALNWSFDTRQNRTHIERTIADIKIVINMVKKDTDHEISKVLQMVSEKYLDIHITDFGSVEYDAEIEKSINRMVPFLMDNSQCKAAMSTYQIAYGMIRENGSTPPVTRHVHSDIPTTPLSAADGSHLIP